MKTAIIKLTNCFEKEISIKVRKPTLVEKIRYQNKIRSTENEEERIKYMMDAGLLIVESIAEGEIKEAELAEEFDDALVQVAYLMYKDSKVEKAGVEPNFTEK